MEILESKIVTTRKEHKCSACSRLFPAGTRMSRTVSVDEGKIYADYTCGTCSTVLDKYDIDEYCEGDLKEISLEFEKEMIKKERQTQLKKGQIYRHFKGASYIVEGIALDTVTEKEVVVYKALYTPESLFTRPIDEFLSEVDREKYPTASQKYRFEAVERK